MEWYTQSATINEEILGLSFTDLKGVRQAIRRTIPRLTRETEQLDYYQEVRRSMERQVQEVLGQQAMELQRANAQRVQSMPVTYSTANNNLVDWWVEDNNPLVSSSTVRWSTTCTASTSATINYNQLYGTYVYGVDTAQPSEIEVEIEVPVGKRMVTVKKMVTPGQKATITDQDIYNALDQQIQEKRVQIITNRAERRAEELLRSLISDIDFRNYKQNGFFIVKQGNRIFRVYKDKSQWVDMWEHDNQEQKFQPKNRLCTHTETRDLPDADEALSKLLLIRSGKIFDHANRHPVNGTRGLEMLKVEKESDLILV